MQQTVSNDVLARDSLVASAGGIQALIPGLTATAIPAASPAAAARAGEIHGGKGNDRGPTATA